MPPDISNTSETLADDLLLGAGSIAHYVLGRDGPKERRKIYYLAEGQKLPIFRIGDTLAARKTELNQSLSAHGNKNSGAT